ncbi:Uncharacterised protein [Streptococcus pneumoniae]|jgi:conserved hypothetical protein|uniref:AbiH family protein n=1 Tax=Streptococcus TaxID=1301 RepID=UPI0007669932|nr:MULTISPECIES: AbiH family protein [Streptococcus]CWE95428.1 Uncharacterised protein [Streptococcus pneumoniae]
MADTILILGNGFDLSMGRKTSYSDFVEFASNLFLEKEDDLQLFLNSNNIDIEKYKDNLFLRFINENKSILGENWSNLERMISQLAEAIDFYRLNPDSIYLSGKNALRVVYVDKFREEIVSQENFASKMFVAEIFYEKFTIFGWDTLERRIAISKLNEFFINHLELLTNLLEIYLSYRDYIDFEINQISPVETALDAITDISESYVISFNYTHTPNKLYNISLEKTHFIHGEIDLSRQKSEINTMVFGIEDKEIDVNSSLIPYQKYYQRIVKETGSEYLDFLKPRRAEDLYGGLKKKNIIVFGHSVDPLDKEIFQNCFTLTSHYTYNYRFIFTYYNEPAKRSIVKNLAIILGKDKLVELTGNKNVVFVKSDDIDGMREVLLD